MDVAVRQAGSAALYLQHASPRPPRLGTGTVPMDVAVRQAGSAALYEQHASLKQAASAGADQHKQAREAAVSRRAKHGRASSRQHQRHTQNARGSLTPSYVPRRSESNGAHDGAARRIPGDKSSTTRGADQHKQAREAAVSRRANHKVQPWCSRQGSAQQQHSRAFPPVIVRCSTVTCPPPLTLKKRPPCFRSSTVLPRPAPTILTRLLVIVICSDQV